MVLQMPDLEVTKKYLKEVPWYRRAWLFVAAIVASVLGTLLLVKGKGLWSKKTVADDQKKQTKVLEERLSDKKEVSEAKIATIEATTAKAEGDAANDHEARTKALAEKSWADAVSAPDVAGGLLDSLKSADRKLR